MLCHRGCGLVGTYVNYKGLQCCSKTAQSCPVVKKKIGDKSGKTRRDNPVKRSPEQRAAQSNNVKQQWVDGKRGKEESKQKSSESNKKHWATHERTPWNKGVTGAQTAWNKGLRKQESLAIISRDDPVYSNFRKYRNRVAVRTKKTYEQFKEEINPLNLPLGKCGVEGAHQIDHKISVRMGFEQGMSIEEISAKENLQILTWLDNVKKYDGKGLRNNMKKVTSATLIELAQIGQ